MPASPLAAALLGGNSGSAASFVDPAIAMATPDLQLGQMMVQEGTSTAPASPWQALARVAQAGAGTYLQRSAISDLAKAYAHSTENAAATLPEGHPLRAALQSSDPFVRMQGLQAYQKALTLLSEPSNLSAGENRYVGPAPIASNTGPQSPEGKAIVDAGRLAAGGNPAAANAITSKISKEGQIGETGVPAPSIPLNVPGARPTLQPAVNPPAMPPADVRVGSDVDTNKDQARVPATSPPGVSGSIAQAKGEIKGAEDTAAANAKYYDSLHRGLSGSAMIAAQQKQNIDLLRQVAASPNFTPGAGSDAALWLQRAAAQLHINTTGAAPREVFNQVAARVLADQMSGIKSMASETGEAGGRIFKPMLDIEEKANITPDDTLAGINAKLNLLDSAGNLMMKWGDRADDYIKNHGGLDAGFDKALRADIAQARIANILPTPAGKTSAAAPVQSPHTPAEIKAEMQRRGLLP